MSNKGDGIGTIFINNKNYKGIKVGTSSVKRKYNIPDENGYTVLKIKCSTESNTLNIFCPDIIEYTYQSLRYFLIYLK